LRQGRDSGQQERAAYRRRLATKPAFKDGLARTALGFAIAAILAFAHRGNAFALAKGRSTATFIDGLGRWGSGFFDGFAVGQLVPGLEVGFRGIAPAPAINLVVGVDERDRRLG
jgi:hypothetical protein